MCHIRDCAVCECDPDEIPACWAKEDGEEEEKEAVRAAAEAEAAAAAAEAAAEAAAAHAPAMSPVLPPPFGASAGGGGGGGFGAAFDAHTSSSVASPPLSAATSQQRIAELSRVNFGREAAGFVGWALPSASEQAAVWSIEDGDGGSSSSSGSGSGSSSAANGGDGGSISKAMYVNLLRNPEGYTGYAGPAAARVWSTIYGENCFSVEEEDGGGSEVGIALMGERNEHGGATSSPTRSTAAAAASSDHGREGDGPHMCFEERVFYRLLSGLHTSINTHIAMTYRRGKGMLGEDDVFQQHSQQQQQQRTGTGGSSSSTLATGSSSSSSYTAASVAHRLLGSVGDSALRLAAALGVPPPALETLRKAWVRGVGVAFGHPEKSAAAQFAHGIGDTRGQPGGGPSDLLLTAGIEPDVDMYLDRIGRHPDRLRNLYFTYLFMLRALDKARPVLESADYSSGDAREDAATRAGVRALIGGVDSPAVLRGFDEGLMFAVQQGPQQQGRERNASDTSTTTSANSASSGLFVKPSSGGGGGGGVSAEIAALASSKMALKAAFRAKYRNISRIMDCVGCEKCRLWGKLQFLGMGTAMRILLGDENPLGAAYPSITPSHLSRNEIVALVNVLHRVSMSLAAIGLMRELEAQRKLHAALLRAAAMLVGTILLLAGARVWLRWRRIARQQRGGAGLGASSWLESLLLGRAQSPPSPPHSTAAATAGAGISATARSSTAAGGGAGGALNDVDDARGIDGAKAAAQGLVVSTSGAAAASESSISDGSNGKSVSSARRRPRRAT